MTLHAYVPGTGKLQGLVYDDERLLINVFFYDTTGLGLLQSDLTGVDTHDVNEPDDAKEHMEYHGQLADALDGLAEEGLVKLVRDADERHGHLKLSTGAEDRESTVGLLFRKKWIDKATCGRLMALV